MCDGKMSVTTTPTTTTDTNNGRVNEALQTIEEERKKNLAECQNAIATILEQYGMDIVAMPAFTTDGRTLAHPVLKFKE